MVPGNSPRPNFISYRDKHSWFRFPDRWKFVDDLTVLETCFKNFKSNPMDIQEQISNEAVAGDMRVDPLKSNIFKINFLKPPISFFCPIPTEMSVNSMTLLVVTISSDLKWDCHVNELLKRTNTAFPPSNSLINLNVLNYIV